MHPLSLRFVVQLFTAAPPVTRDYLATWPRATWPRAHWPARVLCQVPRTRWWPGSRATSTRAPAAPSPSPPTAPPSAGTTPPHTTGSSSTAASGSKSPTMSVHKYFQLKSNIFYYCYQIPDHAAEHDQLQSNPNKRCPGWQFISLPLNPAKVRDLSVVCMVDHWKYKSIFSCHSAKSVL